MLHVDDDDDDDDDAALGLNGNNDLEEEKKKKNKNEKKNNKPFENATAVYVLTMMSTDPRETVSTISSRLGRYTTRSRSYA